MDRYMQKSWRQDSPSFMGREAGFAATLQVGTDEAWMTVQILPYNDPGRQHAENALEVVVHPDACDGGMNLVDITHVYTTASGPGWILLAHRKPMSHEQATAVARAYAKRHGVPMIYVKKPEQ